MWKGKGENKPRVDSTSSCFSSGEAAGRLPRAETAPQVTRVWPQIPQHLSCTNFLPSSSQESLPTNAGSSVPGKQQRLVLVEREKAPPNRVNISSPLSTSELPCCGHVQPLSEQRAPPTPHQPVGSGWWLAAYLQ